MPTLTSDAVRPIGDVSEEKKDHHDDSASSDGDGAKNSDPEAPPPLSEVSISDAEVVDPNEQAGVRKVEAITLTWSKKSLRLIYLK